MIDFVKLLLSDSEMGLRIKFVSCSKHVYRICATWSVLRGLSLQMLWLRPLGADSGIAPIKVSKSSNINDALFFITIHDYWLCRFTKSD